MDSDQKDSNKLPKVNDEFNRNDQYSCKRKNNHDNDFLHNYQVEEIDTNTFKILFDLDTMEAGADYVVIDKTHTRVVCDNYEIKFEHKLDSMNLNQKIMYALRRKEDNPRVIRQILKHLEELRPIIDSIFSYFRELRI